MGAAQYLRDFRRAHNLKKSAELRKRVLQRQEKRKEQSDSVPYKVYMYPKNLFHSNFSWAFLSKGERCMRLTLCEAPTRETRPDHNTGSFIPKNVMVNFTNQSACEFSDEERSSIKSLGH